MFTIILPGIVNLIPFGHTAYIALVIVVRYTFLSVTGTTFDLLPSSSLDYL